MLGGAGFLGSHLVSALVERGARVSVIDNLVTGDWSNLNHLNGGGDGLVLVRHDIAHSIPRIDRPDYVFHLASPASPDDYRRLPIETLVTGADGTRHALEFARAADAPLLFTSTSEVYGDPEVSPQPETYLGNVDPVGPRAAYVEAKRYGEALCTAYRARYDMPIRISRIFNTYGTRMRIGDGRVIPAFFEAALSDRPLTIHGDGRQTRSLCHVSDMVEGLLRLMEVGSPDPVNLGRPDPVEMVELAEMVQVVVGTHPGVEFVDGRPHDPSRREPDISKARAELGWEPVVPLRDGLERCVDWFREALGRRLPVG